MSAIIDTKRVSEELISTLGYDIAFENASYTPIETKPYLRVQLLVRNPEDPVIGDRYYRERFSLNVFVCDRKDVGTANALKIAEEIRSLFHKGQTFIQNNTRIYVLNTPRISGSANAADRLVVPVIIDLVAEVLNQ